MLGVSSPFAAPQPVGWYKAGNPVSDYETGTDPQVKRTSPASAFVRSRSADARGFGTIMQSLPAEAYHGKRVRLTAYVKTENVRQWVGLWMRVDGPAPPGTTVPPPLGFDNMQNRPITGTQDWTKHEIVLDVPANAVWVSFGVMLSGEGAAWIDGPAFEFVGPTVPTTNMLGPKLKCCEVLTP